MWEAYVLITPTWSNKLNKVSVEPVDQPSHVSVVEVRVAAVVTFYRPISSPLSLALV